MQYKIADIAKALGLSKDTINAYFKRHDIKPIGKKGRANLYDETAIKKLKAHYQPAKAHIKTVDEVAEEALKEGAKEAHKFFGKAEKENKKPSPVPTLDEGETDGLAKKLEEAWKEQHSRAKQPKPRQTTTIIYKSDPKVALKVENLEKQINQLNKYLNRLHDMYGKLSVQVDNRKVSVDKFIKNHQDQLKKLRGSALLFEDLENRLRDNDEFYMKRVDSNWLSTIQNIKDFEVRGVVDPEIWVALNKYFDNFFYITPLSDKQKVTLSNGSYKTVERFFQSINPVKGSASDFYLYWVKAKPEWRKQAFRRLDAILIKKYPGYAKLRPHKR